MSGGPMPMRLSLGMMLTLGLAGPVAAETVDCQILVDAVEAFAGLDLSAPPAARQDGWCVLDGARLTGEGAPQVSVERLRVAGTEAEGELLSLEIEGNGLRVRPALNDRDMPGWLRDLLRLQSAEVHLLLERDATADRLVLAGGRLDLSGGGALVLTGEVAGAHLSAPSILTGRVTALHLEWKNDGRTLRPVMEALGTAVDPRSTGTQAVLAARGALLGVVDAVPEGNLPEADAEALAAFIVALPQGRGRLVLDFASGAGIGAAQLGLLALSDDPTSPEALARLFDGARISAGWAPGILD